MNPSARPDNGNDNHPGQQAAENTYREKIPLVVHLISVLLMLGAIGIVVRFEAIAQEVSFTEQLRDYAPVIFLLAWGWCMIAPLLSIRDIKRFLVRYARIEALSAFEQFKAIARQNMYLALLQMIMLGVAFVSGAFVLNDHGLAGSLMITVAASLFWITSLKMTRTELVIRSMEVAPHFEKEYQRICQRWINSALPDF